MPSLNPWLCHRIVRHIIISGIEFDTADLDEGIDGILQLYGWEVVLSDEEKTEISRALYGLALRAESAEIAATYHGDDLLAVMEIEHPYPEQEASPDG